ncbi:MAG: universal stress protein, partial [Alphaproteobacteria bacterium]|nr:universal stress protein [Alphaproteobacteria bacterium]
ATDGSELSNKALGAGLDLARLHGATVTIMTATDPVSTALGGGGFGAIDAGPILDQLDAAYAAQASQVLSAARDMADKAGIAVQTLHIAQQRPADAIVQTASERGCDTIVMGSHGRRGIERMLLGSQAAEVLARATVPVLIVK